MDKLAEEIIINIIGFNINNEEEYPMFQKTLQAMQVYHEVKMKDELIKFNEYLNKEGYGIFEDEIIDYLKQRNNG